MTNARAERERVARVALLEDASPPANQYAMRHARTPRDVLEALKSLAGEIDPATRPSPLQSPLVTFYDPAAGDYDARPASGATKPVPADVTPHRPRARATRSRKGRSSFVVTNVAAVSVIGPDPVLDPDGSQGLTVRMLGRDLAALADALYDIPALIGGIDGRRNSWHYETDRMVRQRKPSADERARDLMTTRDTDNPSVARWSGDLLSWFPEIRDRAIVEGDETTFADAIESETSSRQYSRPAESHRTRQSMRPVSPRTSLGERETMIDPADPAAECVCQIVPMTRYRPIVERDDSGTYLRHDPACRAHTRVLLIGPATYRETDHGIEARAFLGHAGYERPTIEPSRAADPEYVRAARDRTRGMSETPAAIAAIDAAEAAMSVADRPAQWNHGNYYVTADPARDGRWTLSVYDADPRTSRASTRVMRRTVRSARAAGIALASLS